MDGMPIRRQGICCMVQELRVEEEKNQCGPELLDHPGAAQSKNLLSWMKLCGGAFELAFDHDNGDVITEADVAAEVCRAVKDIHDELFRRE